MGDWTGTVPTFAAGAKLRGVDMQTLADIDTALATGWTTWVPTYANLTITTATIVAKYRRVGKAVDYRWKFKLGASSAVGTAPTLTLPFTPSADWAATPDFDRFLIGNIFDTSTTSMRDLQVYLSTAPATLTLNYMNAGVPAQITATAPWTWATGDTLAIYGTYYTD